MLEFANTARARIFNHILENAVDGVWTGNISHAARSLGIPVRTASSAFITLRSAGKITLIREGTERHPGVFRIDDTSPITAWAPQESEEWPQERVDRLVQMYNEDRTRLEIQAEIGGSKNVIVGKIARLAAAGVIVRKPPTKAKEGVRRKKRPKPIALATISVTATVPVIPRYISRYIPRHLPQPIQRVTARYVPAGKCQFPMWGHHESPTGLFCDAKVEVRSYCLAHAIVCYERPRMPRFEDQMV